MEKIIILGQGGHAKSLVDIIECQNRFRIAGYIVNEANGLTEGLDYPVLGKDEDLKAIFDDGIRYAAMGIGFLGKSRLREKLYNQLKKIGYELPLICDPSAVISPKAILQEGSMVGKGAVINAGARIGKLCIINTGAIIEHDCQVGDFSHVSVGAVLCGQVEIGRETFVGANATIIQGRRIEDGCIIAAGAVVRRGMGRGEFAGE